MQIVPTLNWGDGKALKLYQKCIAEPDSSLALSCCNFKMLEKM